MSIRGIKTSMYNEFYIIRYEIPGNPTGMFRAEKVRGIRLKRKGLGIFPIGQHKYIADLKTGIVFSKPHKSYKEAKEYIYSNGERLRRSVEQDIKEANGSRHKPIIRAMDKIAEAYASEV